MSQNRPLYSAQVVARDGGYYIVERADGPEPRTFHFLILSQVAEPLREGGVGQLVYRTELNRSYHALLESPIPEWWVA